MDSYAQNKTVSVYSCHAWVQAEEDGHKIGYFACEASESCHSDQKPTVATAAVGFYLIQDLYLSD